MTGRNRFIGWSEAKISSLRLILEIFDREALEHILHGTYSYRKPLEGLEIMEQLKKSKIIELPKIVQIVIAFLAPVRHRNTKITQRYQCLRAFVYNGGIYWEKLQGKKLKSNEVVETKDLFIRKSCFYVH